MEQTPFTNIENILSTLPDSYPRQNEMNDYSLIVNESSLINVISENLNIGNNNDEPKELEHNLKNNSRNTSHHLSQEEMSYNSCDPCQHTWDCEWSGKYIPYKNVLLEKQKNKGSKRISCPFLVNMSKKIKELIESYTFCDLDMLSQIKLLHELFFKTTIVDYDVKNYVYKFCQIHEMQDGNVAKLLQHYEKECAKDPDWYIQLLIDLETNRLQGVFYMLPEQRELWQHYADIILNDNTASTNTYNLPLSIFAIVNNNFKLRIIAQVVLIDKTNKSYRWVLQQTIEATGVQPGAFIIDANLGLESVVLKIYLNTYLLHCIWHIKYNLKKQLSKPFGDYYESTEYLVKQLDSRKTTWAKAFTSQFSAWCEKTLTYATLNVCRKLFLNIYNILQKYITPKILQLHVDQMNKAVIYNDKKKLLERIDHSLITESAMPIKPPEQAAAKVISQKQSAKGILLKLAYKCIESVDYDNPNDLMKMFKECGSQVEKHAQASCLEVQNSLQHVGK
ncbi:23573_t:CDS:2, partial [Cetraspora pellucida]